MTIKSLPWPFQPGVGPTYSADDWINVWSWLGYHDGRVKRNTGVLGGRGSFLTFNAGFPAVQIMAGAALVNGRFVEVPGTTTPSVSAAHPTYKRIDLLVLRTNATTQSAQLFIREGTPGPAPVAPTPVQDNNPFFELPLFELHVRAGATAWLGTDFVDVRRFAVDPASVILDTWLNYSPLPTVAAGAPVFVRGIKPVAPADTFPFMPIAGLYGHEVSESAAPNTLLLGVAAERTTSKPILPVLTRGFTTLTLSEAVSVGEMIVVHVRNDDTLTIGRAPTHSAANPVRSWKPLGIVITSALAGEQCLVWVDPLTHQAALREWTVGLSSDFATTSTTPVLVTGVGLTGLRLRSPRVAVAVAGQARHSAVGGECTLSLMMGSSPIAGIELGYHQLSVAGQNQNISIERNFDWSLLCHQAGGGLVPGDAQSLWLMARTNSGTLTLRSGLQFRVRGSTTGA